MYRIIKGLRFLAAIVNYFRGVMYGIGFGDHIGFRAWGPRA